MKNNLYKPSSINDRSRPTKNANKSQADLSGFLSYPPKWIVMFTSEVVKLDLIATINKEEKMGRAFDKSECNLNIAVLSTSCPL